MILKAQGVDPHPAVAAALAEVVHLPAVLREVAPHVIATITIPKATINTPQAAAAQAALLHLAALLPAGLRAGPHQAGHHHLHPAREVAVAAPQT